MTINQARWLTALIYAISILLGNLFVIWFGIVSFFGISFPAGAIWIGLTFSARDFVQRFWGHRVWYFMLACTAITTVLSLQVALASAAAFLGSEAIDWFVFTLMKNRSMKARLAVSNIFSCPLDSLLFVTIAFGFFWPAIWGQTLVKYISGFLAWPAVNASEKFYFKLVSSAHDQTAH
ncbi:MAG: VUT family protein [Deltaproteobacteria bacterium]|nr:VUT family protein [Deltaproteobacteria bacterium]